MKTIYKYIEFIQDGKMWTCSNMRSGDPLGTVSWYPYRKSYAFQAMSDVEFSPDCLRDIAEFMENLNKERKP